MITTRDISQTECPWLPIDIAKNTTLFKYINYTYGCISPEGVAISFEHNKEPFYEVPKNAIRE